MNDGFNRAMDELRKANQTIDRIQKNINEVNTPLDIIKSLLLLIPFVTISFVLIVALFL